MHLSVPNASDSTGSLAGHNRVSRLECTSGGLVECRKIRALAGHAVPTDDERVKATVRGIRRALGTATREKAPATAARVISMALGTGNGLKALRDHALLLGFAARSAGPNSSPSIARTSRNARAGSGSPSAAARRTRRDRARPLPSSTARSVARSPRCRLGAARPASTPGRSFAAPWLSRARHQWAPRGRPALEFCEIQRGRRWYTLSAKPIVPRKRACRIGGIRH